MSTKDPTKKTKQQTAAAPDEGVPFIPDWNDERQKALDNPNHEPVTFYLRPITEADQDYYDMLISITGGDESQEAIAKRIARLNRAWITMQVVKVENLKLADGEDVIDGKSFLDCRGEIQNSRTLFYELITEIGKTAGLNEGEVKN